MGVDVIYNHADYTLTSKLVLSELNIFEETNLFSRGLISLIGFCSTSFYYDRSERFVGG